MHVIQGGVRVPSFLSATGCELKLHYTRSFRPGHTHTHAHQGNNGRHRIPVQSRAGKQHTSAADIQSVRVLDHVTQIACSGAIPATWRNGEQSILHTLGTATMCRHPPAIRQDGNERTNATGRNSSGGTLLDNSSAFFFFFLVCFTQLKNTVSILDESTKGLPRLKTITAHTKVRSGTHSSTGLWK